MAKQTIRIARKAINKVAAAARKEQRREKLILDHVHVVERIAIQIHRKMTHLDPEDLKQAGFVGLCEAANRYKRSAGVFEHYCYFRIRGAMIDAHKRSAYRNDTHNSLEKTFTYDHTGDELPRHTPIDKRPLPDAFAARTEQSRLLYQAIAELDPDEQRVFRATLGGIALLTTATECQRSVAWARAKLASARMTLGAKVQMWGLGLDKAA